uniref:Maturase K n=1 Tax=Echinocereus laui TaxID=867012 RepID=H1ZTN1_9CARY|nr:maturase K [Echinocereus laui]
MEKNRESVDEFTCLRGTLLFQNRIPCFDFIALCII